MHHYAELSMTDDDVCKSEILANYSNVLQAVYERTGSMETLEKTLAKRKLALEAAPKGHSFRTASLSNFAGTLQLRYERTADLEDLNRSVTLNEEGVRETLPNDP